ncbi:MAG: CRTAC1 family protein [Pseudomonadota bacterium]|nr:CRTAC1 family protein [Pseudomonadota bacterium]
MNPILLHFLAACTPTEGNPDPVVPTCDPAPSSAWSGETTFEDRTEAWGLPTTEGGRLQAVDLDGDRYPDLVVTQVFSNARDDLAAVPPVRYHYVMMNRPGEGGARVFVDESEQSGLLQNRDGGTGTSATVFVYGDVDNDHDLDVFAGRYYDAGATDVTGDCSEILLNDGAGHFTFADRSDPCDLEGYPVTAASFTDYDADGILDLWQVAFYTEYGYLASSQDQLLHGNGDGTFTDVTNDVGLAMSRGRAAEDYLTRTVRRPAYGATACDLDGDTLPELIATNYGRSWNQLWSNRGGSFVDVAEEAHFDDDDNQEYADNLMYACYCEQAGGCAVEPTVECGGLDFGSWTPGYDDQPARLAGNGFTTVCADIDNDGDNDAYTASIVHDWAGESADPTQLLLNDGNGIFALIDNADNGLARARPLRSSWNEGDLHAAFMDFDNDGWKDIVLGSSDYEDTHVWLWRQVSAGQFEEVSDATGLNHPWPAGMAIADFDLDGDLDFVTGSSFQREGSPWTTREVHFYENTAPVGNWVRLPGLSVGTRVDLTAGGVTQTQEVSGGYGHAGIQNDTALHFGLGGACLIDTIVVTAPGGAQTTHTNQLGNQALDLE